MKRPKNQPINTRRINRNNRSRDALTETLKLCLQKICELQQEIENDEPVQDAQAAGYSACVMETFRFLNEQGLPPNHPIVKALSEKLLGQED